MSSKVLPSCRGLLISSSTAETRNGHLCIWAGLIWIWLRALAMMKVWVVEKMSKESWMIERVTSEAFVEGEFAENWWWEGAAYQIPKYHLVSGKENFWRQLLQMDSICLHFMLSNPIHKSISKMKIAFVNLAVTGNGEEVEKGGVPSHTPHLKQCWWWSERKGGCWLTMWKKGMVMVRLNITKITMIKMMMTVIKMKDTGSRCLAAPFSPNILRGWLLLDLWDIYLARMKLFYCVVCAMSLNILMFIQELLTAYDETRPVPL